jgi:hypothetical protein
MFFWKVCILLSLKGYMVEFVVEIANRKSLQLMPMELWLGVQMLQWVMGSEIYPSLLELYSLPEEE